MYLEFFGLREKPFGLTPDPKFLFFSEKHREALDHLLYGIHQKEGFVLISGDTGTGKTTLCRALLERLDPQEIKTSLVLNPLLNEKELLKAILEDFGLPSAGATKKDLLDVLNRFLLKTLAAGGTAVLIIDEAQHLSTECLEQVRLLSNLETHKEKLIQIILVGSEELPAKLETFALRHLQQRISLRYHLRPLDKKETRSYLQHRLNMARAAGSTSFDKGAHREIYRFSKGVPRLINIIAERSLLAAYLGGSRKVRQTHVVDGRQSLNGRFPRSRPRSVLRFGHGWKGASVALSVLVIASALVFVPTIREMLRGYVNRGFTQKSFAPLNYSRQFVRAEIPQPKPAVMRSPVRTEERNVTSPLGVDRDSSVERFPGGLNSKARPAREDGEEGQKTAGLAKGDRRPSKERFPQYLLKPPYVYTVQVESFQDPEIAAARMRELQNRGFDAWVAWIDLGEMGTWYRVLVGKYKDKGEAQAMARKLSQKSEFQRARQIATHKESAKAEGANKD
ncbi:MAG: AAA family ATPase [Deltaproteobacteria bacterium]|nr:MAG: AAA family ATPase [Deltaproteobacteria bacterium]